MLLALARRLPVGQPAAGADGSASGQWELRDQGWTLVAPSGTAISLSANERLIVRSLLEVAGRAVGRNELGDELRVEGGGAAPAARAAST